jgi:hypothetical protein
MTNYPEISLDDFASIKWRQNRMNLSAYLDLECQCAHCGTIDKFSNYAVELEGAGMRLLVTCDRCEKKSIVRPKGFFKIKIVTQYKVPVFNDNLKFPTCRLCDKETSLTGNLTNMALSGIDEPDEFNNKYGMMCSNHAGQITKQIMEDKGLTEADFHKAHERAKEIMQRKLYFDGLLR